MLTTLQQIRVNQFKKTLNPQSKWYNDDLQNFIDNVKNEHADKSKQMIANIDYMNSKELDKFIKNEENKMLKAGMYNIQNMQPKNCLD